jgi:hypothetical protein
VPDPRQVHKVSLRLKEQRNRVAKTLGGSAAWQRTPISLSVALRTLLGESVPSPQRPARQQSYRSSIASGPAVSCSTLQPLEPSASLQDLLPAGARKSCRELKSRQTFSPEPAGQATCPRKLSKLEASDSPVTVEGLYEQLEAARNDAATLRQRLQETEEWAAAECHQHEACQADLRSKLAHLQFIATQTQRTAEGHAAKLATCQVLLRQSEEQKKFLMAHYHHAQARVAQVEAYSRASGAGQEPCHHGKQGMQALQAGLKPPAQAHFSANGASINGASANGASANGASANGALENVQRVAN